MRTMKPVKRLNFTMEILSSMYLTLPQILTSKWIILKLFTYLMATQKCLVLMAHMVLGLFQVGDHVQLCRVHLDNKLDKISISYQFKESTLIYVSLFIWTTIVIGARRGKYGTIWSSLMLVIQMTIMMEISPG